MSDSEAQPIFEEPVTLVVEPVAEAVAVDEPVTEAVAEPPKKLKKPRKPMSDERKEQLRQNLIKGRATSLANRQKKAKTKGTFKKVKTLEEGEAEERALEVAKVRIAEAEARKEQRETAKNAKKEAGDAMTLARELRKELDELKSERAASKARKAKIKAQQKEADDKRAAEAAEKEAAKPKIVPPKPPPTGRDLIRLMKGL